MKINFNYLCSYTLTAIAFAYAPIATKAQQKTTDSLIAVINAHPDNVSAHEAYIQSSRTDSLKVIKQYRLWMKKYPKVAAVPYGYGIFYTHQESPAARPFLLKAVALDPKLAAAWAELAIDAERWGEFKKSSEYLGKAVAAEPDNADYFSSYAYSFENSDPEKYVALSQELIKKFPESPRSAQSLYWLAFRTVDKQQKQAYYEQLRRDYPVTKFDWSAWAMSEYFDVLLADHPEQALQLVSELANAPGLDTEKKAGYEKQAKLANQIIQANQLLSNQKPAEAIALLSTVKVKDRGEESTLLTLLNAKALAQAGNPQQAYDTLLKYFVKKPARSTKEALIAYGEKAGKSAATVNTDIRQRLAAVSKEAAFNFNAYMAPGKVSLKDYKGKVVLLTFFFPGCGPCRGEFPHFERVLKNFQGQPISYVAVNIAPEQDEYVIPFVKTSGYSFTVLKDKEADRHNLPVWGAPSNFLIDQNGRIIFSNFMIQNHDAELMLQDMIQLLLSQSV